MDLAKEVLVNLVVPGLVALLLAGLFEVAREYAGKIKNERLREIVLALVKAAEQMYGKGRGTEKKAAVVEAAPKGVTDAMIEAAVYDLNEYKLG